MIIEKWVLILTIVASHESGAGVAIEKIQMESWAHCNIAGKKFEKVSTFNKYYCFKTHGELTPPEHR